MNSYRNVGFVCALLTALLGLITLIGWLSGLEALASIRRDYIPMAPSTALCFAIFGATRLLPQSKRLVRRFTRVLIVLVAVFVTEKLCEFFFDTSFTVERWLVADPAMFGSVQKGRMSPITAANFLFLCMAALCMSGQRLRCYASGLATVPLVASFVVLLGYLHGTPLLYYAGTIIPVALPTAAALLLLSISLITQSGPEYWPLAAFVGTSTRAVLLRWFLPAMLGLAVGIGVLRTKILTERVVNPALSSALSTLLLCLLVTIIISKVAQVIGNRIDRAERERDQAQADLRMLNDQLEQRVAERTLELQTKNRQMEEELVMARELQFALLPQRFPTIPNSVPPPESALRFFSFYYPTGSVSGDFFNVFPVSDSSVGIFICDVMGHGVRAALITSMMRALLEQNCNVDTEPGKLLSRMNDGLVSILRNAGTTVYATALVMIADVRDSKLRYANAGHPKPLHVRRGTGEAFPLANPASKGPALGIFPGASYATAESPMATGDLIMLFTDGLFEVEGKDEELYSHEALCEAVRKRSALPAQELFDGVLTEVRSFAAQPSFEDDVCIIGVEFAKTNGASGPRVDSAHCPVGEAVNSTALSRRSE